MSHICLACGGSLAPPLFSVRDLPLVDSFCTDVEAARSVPRYSIDLCQCHNCQTIQIASPPDTTAIYKDYIYESSSSPDLLEHFAEYAQFVKSTATNIEDPVLEIGANDGLLLTKLSEAGFKDLTGIDPSPQTRSIKIPDTKIINDFFNHSSTSDLSPAKFGTIIANNCFSHIPNLDSVLSLCKDLLRPKGMLIVEVQSTLDLVEGLIFDYIYHEHYFYHTVTSFEILTRLSGLELFSVKHVETKGGSYRLLIGHTGANKKDGSVEYWKYRERVAGVHTTGSWQSMREYLDALRKALHEVLAKCGTPIVAYGASATGTVFMRYMDVEDRIDFIVDDNPKRQGLFAPGTGIPVRSVATCNQAGLCVILAWRHARHIIPKVESFGVPYLTPLPMLAISE
jgi:SAM-dependent methyltransferase